MSNRFRSSLTRLLTLALPVATAFAMGTGCLIVNDRDEGDIAFLWSFDGEPNCDTAGVSDVVVTVYEGDTLRFEDVVECSGGGLTVRDFAPGTYDVVLQGLASDDFLLFEGAKEATVRDGQVTDIGEIYLDRGTVTGPTGEVQFAWTFQYPNNDSVETDCARAGVNEIDVLLTPAAGNNVGQVFSRSYNCTDDGVRIEDLAVGEYELVLRGFGTYNNGDIDLYEAAPLSVVIIENDPDLVGDVSLLRNDQNFADIDVNWLLPTNETCASLGVNAISFSLSRVGSNVVDDAFDVACDAAQTEVRANFVPGDYNIEASAAGAGNTTLIGNATFDVAPGTTTPIDVEIN